MIKFACLICLLLTSCTLLSIPRYSLWLPTLVEQPTHPKFESVVVVNSPHGQGTGFVVNIIAEHVYILTAAHVVPEEWVPYFAGNQSATTIAIDETHDLALLAVKNSGLYDKIHQFGLVEVEDPVWVVGYVELNGIIGVIHPGFVVSTDFDGYIAYNGGGGRGMSGGPMFNKSGEVVGIASFVTTEWFVPNFTEFCFVPSSIAQDFVMRTLTNAN